MIISTFLKEDESGDRDARDEVLALELLAYNFHDAIDVGPLFYRVKTNINRQADVTDHERPQLIRRLERVAKEITGKQLASLDDSGVKTEAFVTFESILSSEGREAVAAIKKELPLKDVDGNQDPRVPPRKFYLDVLSADMENHTLDVQLEVVSGVTAKTELAANFELGFFDFPMIDSSRLPGGQRVSISLRDWEPESHVQIALAYFPSSRASLKEKPFYEDIVEQLHSVGEKVD